MHRPLIRAISDAGIVPGIRVDTGAKAMGREIWKGDEPHVSATPECPSKT